MNINKKVKLPIKIYTSFIVLMIITIALGYLEQFFIMVFTVTIHELSHIAMAKIFGLNTEKLIITPLGQVGIIHDLVFLKLWKKIAIILAGPFMNLIIAGVFSIFATEKFDFFININLVIGIFNLIPCYPFDGGRFWHFILSYKWGVLRSNNIVYKIGCFAWIIFVVLGILQVILYPPNISLISMGIYVFYINKKEYFNISFEFFKNIIIESDKTERNVKNKNVLVLDKNYSIKKIINLLNYDFVYDFLILDGKGNIITLTQKNITDYAKKNGMKANVEDVYISF